MFFFIPYHHRRADAKAEKSSVADAKAEKVGSGSAKATKLFKGDMSVSAKAVKSTESAKAESKYYIFLSGGRCHYQLVSCLHIILVSPLHEMMYQIELLVVV